MLEATKQFFIYFNSNEFLRMFDKSRAFFFSTNSLVSRNVEGEDFLMYQQLQASLRWVFYLNSCHAFSVVEGCDRSARLVKFFFNKQVRVWGANYGLKLLLSTHSLDGGAISNFSFIGSYFNLVSTISTELVSARSSAFDGGFQAETSNFFYRNPFLFKYSVAGLNMTNTGYLSVTEFSSTFWVKPNLWGRGVIKFPTQLCS